MKFLKAIREKAGLSQKKLAGKLGVDENSVWRWEAGRAYPSVDLGKQIAELLGVSVDELLYGPQSKEWRIEVVFRREEDWEMNTVDMSASAPNLFLVQVGMEKIGLNLVGDPADEAELDGLWDKAKPQILKMIAMRRELGQLGIEAISEPKGPVRFDLRPRR
ncbi:helix-turn-helix transcriptional regulator [Fretibacterium fastidiosum]|uniref:helix-turn-helix transcriptional regulator n=2 Tax=Fretibacterium fastidiosum TaxID=651822 RepID=UPI001AD80445|nr:helix-turn-helix transcriptional regulator [Fretibacterium fastidiosum]